MIEQTVFQPMDIEELFQRLEETKQMLLELKQQWAICYAHYCVAQKHLIDMDIRIGILAVYNARNALSTWDQRHQEELIIQAEQRALREKEEREYAEYLKLKNEADELACILDQRYDPEKNRRLAELKVKMWQRGYFYSPPLTLDWLFKGI